MGASVDVSENRSAALSRAMMARFLDRGWPDAANPEGGRHGDLVAHRPIPRVGPPARRGARGSGARNAPRAPGDFAAAAPRRDHVLRWSRGEAGSNRVRPNGVGSRLDGLSTRP